MKVKQKTSVSPDSYKPNIKYFVILYAVCFGGTGKLMGMNARFYARKRREKRGRQSSLKNFSKVHPVTYRQADKEELGIGVRWSGPGGEAHLQGARPGPASSPTTYKLLVVVTTVSAAYPGWRAAGFHYVTCTLYSIVVFFIIPSHYIRFSTVNVFKSRGTTLAGRESNLLVW